MADFSFSDDQELQKLSAQVVRSYLDPLISARVARILRVSLALWHMR